MDTALVVLRSAAGKVPRPEEVTAERLGDVLPDPEAVYALRDHLHAAGCQVGPLVGISFSVSAPADRLTELFGHRRPDGWTTDRLPPRMAATIAAVTTGPEADFGPVDY